MPRKGPQPVPDAALALLWSGHRAGHMPKAAIYVARHGHMPLCAPVGAGSADHRVQLRRICRNPVPDSTINVLPRRKGGPALGETAQTRMRRSPGAGPVRLNAR